MHIPTRCLFKPWISEETPQQTRRSGISGRASQWLSVVLQGFLRILKTDRKVAFFCRQLDSWFWWGNVDGNQDHLGFQVGDFFQSTTSTTTKQFVDPMLRVLYLCICGLHETTRSFLGDWILTCGSTRYCREISPDTQKLAYVQWSYYTSSKPTVFCVFIFSFQSVSGCSWTSCCFNYVPLGCNFGGRFRNWRVFF